MSALLDLLDVRAGVDGDVWLGPASGPEGIVPSVQSPNGLVQPSMKNVVTIGARMLTHSPSAPFAGASTLVAMSSARAATGTRPTVTTEIAAAATSLHRMNPPPRDRRNTTVSP